MADIAETIEHFQPVWLNFLENPDDINSVIKKYNDLGYNASSDLPTNGHWKELYKNMDNCKVVLTIRNDSNVWAKSFKKFFYAQGNRYGKFIGTLFYRPCIWGLMGPRIQGHCLLRESEKNFF